MALEDSNEVVFATTLAARRRSSLEELFFFNPGQTALLSKIQAAVEQTGMPKLVETDGRIWIDVPANPMQCLFATDHRGIPLGVALYNRPAVDHFWIVHLAGRSALPVDGPASLSPAMLLVQQIQTIARAVTGVVRIRLPYGNRFLMVRPSSIP